MTTPSFIIVTPLTGLQQMPIPINVACIHEVQPGSTGGSSIYRQGTGWMLVKESVGEVVRRLRAAEVQGLQNADHQLSQQEPAVRSLGE